METVVIQSYTDFGVTVTSEMQHMWRKVGKKESFLAKIKNKNTDRKQKVT